MSSSTVSPDDIDLIENHDATMTATSEQYIVQLIELLDLDADSVDARSIALDLIDKGRKRLAHYRNDIALDTYDTLMRYDHSELLSLLSKAIRQQWATKEPTWFDSFLIEQNTKEPDMYERILHLVAEHGSARMRGCVPLALVILFQYKVFENRDFQSNGKFDQILQKMKVDGRKGCPDASAPAGDNDPLLLALRQFYRDEVVTRLKSADVPNTKLAAVIELAVDLVALNGWDGLKDETLKRRLSPKVFEKLNVMQGGGGSGSSGDGGSSRGAGGAEEDHDPQNNTTHPPTTVPDKSPQTGSDSQQNTNSASNTTNSPFQYAKEQGIIQSCVNTECLLTIRDLTQAGELMYTTDSLTSIAARLLHEFNTNHKQLSNLIRDCLVPMMYLLKRELNLLDFIKLIKQGLITNRTIPRPSQRMLVDILLKNSEDFLAQILIKLLSKRNVVPLFEAQDESQEFVPHIIHVWDYEKPTILSFGIGPCAGKSSLLNSLFLSNFEQTLSSSYFQQTIDVDFGYNFIPVRPINVADVHGQMSLNLLDKVSRLFDGFIIHVNTAFLFSNLSLVKQFLDHLPNNAYRLLLIRDSTRDEDGTTLGQLSINEKLFLPQIIDKTTDDSQVSLKELLKIIYDTGNFTTKRLSKNDVEVELCKLLPPRYRAIFDQQNELIRSITSTLISGDKKHFPLYDIFVEMCKKRDELSRIDFYGSQNNEAMFNIQAELYDLEVKLKSIGGQQKDCGEAFRVFSNLLQNPSKFSTLSILASALKQEIDKKLQASQQAVDLPYEQRLSMEVHWRNAIVSYDHIPSIEQKQELVQHYRDIIASGQPFEIIDGDNFFYQSSFLEKVMVNMQDVRFFVISIIGPQNSGKSTLLNYMFGTLFDVRDGRCTRGVYGSMVKSNRPDFDYIMLIDTEGLLGVEKNDEEYDRRLILFCLAVSHLVIVNVAGEVSATLMKMLILCTDSLQKLGVNKVHRPPVHIVLNQRANPDVEINKAAMNKIKEELVKVKLDQQIELNDKTFHTLPSAFKRDRVSDEQTKATVLRTDPDFIENVQRLCEQFVSTAAKSLEQTREQFSDPLRWVKFAATVLEILRKFPDMTYFNDIREREQDDLMREWIRKILENTFTACLRRDLLNETIGQSVREIKTNFELKFQTLRENLVIALKYQLKLIAAMENIRKRSESFLSAQIDSLLRAWIESAIMNNERHQLEELVHKGETQFHELIQRTIEAIRKDERHELGMLVTNADTQFLDDIQATIRSTGRLSNDQAGNMFDKIWNETYPRVASEFVHDKQIQAALQFVYRNYHIFEKSNLPDVKVLLPLLTYIPLSVELTAATPRVNGATQEQNDTQILQKIQTVCIQQMLSYTPIQELQFKYDTTAEYTRRTIHDFKNFYVPTLIQEYDTYHHEKTDNIWSREFHLHLRRFILKTDAAPTSSNAQPGIWKRLLHVKKSFEKLLKITQSVLILGETNACRRPVDIDLVQQLVGMILGHINEINDELDVFKLAASKHYLGMMHTYTVLILTKFYYDEQWRFFDDVLLKVREKKPGWRDYFIAMVTQDQKADPRFAEDLVKVFVDSVIEYFQKKVKEKIRAQTELDGKTLDRSTLLDDLDTSVSSMSNDELYDYMKDPLAALSRKFNERWMKIKAAIELFIVECKQKCKLIIDQFFQLLEIIQSVLQQFQADKVTFISQLFTTCDGSDALNTVNKGRCASLFLYAYLCQTNPFPSQFQLFNVTYLLSETGMQMIKQFQPPTTDVKAIFLTMADKFNSTSILNLAVFVQKCLGQKLTAHESFENKSKNSIIILNELCVKEEQIFQIKQCKGDRSACPCCNRICDVDHSIDKTSAPGTGNNLHHCQIGHQYRAFARVKHVNKNNVTGLHEPSMQRCEHLQDRDRVTIVNVNGGIETVRWADYVLKNKDWNWDIKLQQTSTSSCNLSTNLPTIWSRIGKQWCQKHDMDFVTMNKKTTGVSSLYNASVGQSIIANALSYDQYGNPKETIYDLGQDGAFSDYSILIGQFYSDGQFNDTAMKRPIDALKVKGFEVKHVKNESEFITELQSKRHQIAWVISTSSIQNGTLMTALTTFHSAGGAIFLFADNVPYICHASEFLQRKFGITLTGDYYGGKNLTYKENGRSQTGNFGQHDIFTGIQNLFEGITICHPLYPTQQSQKAFVTLATATDGNPSIAVYDPSVASSEGRLALDCGFTKLYCNWDTAGTARYIVNVSCWLLRI